MSKPLVTSTVASQTYRRATYVVLFLGFLGIGSSNVIGYLAAPQVVRIEPISAIVTPIFFVSAYFIWRHFYTAYRIALIAFGLSSIASIVMSVLNRERIIEIAGNSGFIGIMLGNIVYALIIWNILYKGYQELNNAGSAPQNDSHTV